MNRRTWLSALLTGAGASMAAACDRVTTAPATTRTLLVAEKWNKAVHRTLIGRHALAPEFEPKDISAYFKPNGTFNPQDVTYKALAAGGFADWRLVVDGLVEQPLALSLAELRAQPSRTQITRHDCVEGWSSIGQWKGARLSALLDRARLKPQAKFIVFHCMDKLDAGPLGRYYESIDLTDARHAQTILAYEMNGRPLPVAHGAPVRLRVERQLGYKQAKYIHRIEAVADFSHIAGGKGGYWEDRGYEWYAGI